MRGNMHAYRHPLVRFVGLDAYEAAGGGIRRDLFADDAPLQQRRRPFTSLLLMHFPAHPPLRL